MLGLGGRDLTRNDARCSTQSPTDSKAPRKLVVSIKPRHWRLRDPAFRGHIQARLCCELHLDRILQCLTAVVDDGDRLGFDTAIMDTAALSRATPSPLPTMSTPAPSPLPAQQSSTDFQFPPHYSFPPFYTLQPNLTTLSRQLALWSSLVQSYCAHNRIFKLSLSTASSSPLFYNSSLNRRLDLLSIRKVLDYMSSPEGDSRAEWITTAKKSRDASSADNKSSAWIYWRRLEEWADAIYGWVDGTGQKGSVLTVYELRESDAVQSQDWIGMDEDMFRRCLERLVRRGKAQIFGDDDGAGVKFF